jgi:hypothetical protein
MGLTIFPWGLYGAVAAVNSLGWVAGRRFAAITVASYATVVLTLSLAHFA